MLRWPCPARHHPIWVRIYNLGITVEVGCMRAIFAIFVVCALLLVGAGWPQESATTPAAEQGHTPAAPPPSPGEIEMQKRVAKQRSQERFVKIKKDTDQLLELATQLKKSVDEANAQTLSLEVIRKAEQIEKLARQVRQKMLGGD
jgi:hypothetical protein